MDNVLAARALMGVSLGFHIVYATIGIGLPQLQRLKISSPLVGKGPCRLQILNRTILSRDKLNRDLLSEVPSDFPGKKE